MAQQVKTVYTVENFRLLDGTELEVKPLPIKKLRKATNKINGALAGHPVTDDEGNELLDSDGEVRTRVEDEELIDAFVDVVELVMEGQTKCEKFLEPDNGRDELENTLDQDTLYEIVRVSTGFDFLEMQKQMRQMMERGLSQ